MSCDIFGLPQFADVGNARAQELKVLEESSDACEAIKRHEDLAKHY